jgi:hypothetical protein
MIFAPRNPCRRAVRERLSEHIPGPLIDNKCTATGHCVTLAYGGDGLGMRYPGAVLGREYLVLPLVIPILVLWVVECQDVSCDRRR